ncbi:MAG: PQQ-binding-like beta-propeller repeat protein [Pirellulales bacterium]
MLHRLCLLLLLAIAAALSNSAHAQEWTRFRGPNGAGQSDSAGIPTEFSATDNTWRIELPGIGHSSPVLWGEKLFLTSGDPAGGDQYVMCIDAITGRNIWTRTVPSEPHHLHERNSFASGTPAVDDQRLYLAWATPDSYKLMAMSHEGEEVWQRDLGPFVSQHGFGTSPIVYGEMLIISNDQREGGESFLLAVDRKTGETRWKTPRPSREAAYSTPCVRTTPDGSEELIFNSGAAGIAGVDPATGAINWNIEVFEMRSVSSPVLAGDLIFGSCGSGAGGNYVVAVRPGDKSGTAAKIAYRVAESAPYVPTSVVAGERAFLWWDKGAVTCIDIADGKVHYKNRVPGGYSGSPVRVGSRIFCINDDGEVIVLAAEPEFKVLARNSLGDYSRATPSIALGRMYLRTYSSLVCIGGEPSAETAAGK